MESIIDFLYLPVVVAIAFAIKEGGWNNFFKDTKQRREDFLSMFKTYK